jgi:hypothetical protein
MEMGIRGYPQFSKIRFGSAGECLNSPDIYPEKFRTHESIQAEVKVFQARFAELGHVSIYLGDRMATPLSIVQLISEELLEIFGSGPPSESDIIQVAKHCETLEKNIAILKTELEQLNRFRNFAPSDALIRKLGQ